MTYRLASPSPTQQDVLDSVSRFRQLSSSQLRRLHYQGTPRGRVVRCSRHLSRLVSLGLLTRLERVQGGYGGGSGEHVYQLPTTKARTPDVHSLDVAELYVQLREPTWNMNGAYSTFEPDIRIIAFDPEPYCHIKIGHMELKPDAYVKLSTGEWWIEVDKSSEFRSQLAFKMRRYVTAFNQWDTDKHGEVFPLCLWVVPDDDRKRVIEGVIRSQAEPELFAVVVFKDAVKELSGETG